MNKRHEHHLGNKAASYKPIPSSPSVGMDMSTCTQVIVRCLCPDLRDSNIKVLRRILIVDREPVVADMIALMCATLGWMSSTASSIEQACAATRRHTFDLILTDYNLPPDNGLMLICRLRQLGLEVPAIMMTDTPSISKYLDPSILNISMVLVKPLTRETLETVLGKCTR